MPSPRDLANVHSIRPVRAIPTTSRPRCRSSDGVHGTRLNPSPSSITAKRPDRQVETLTIGAAAAVARGGRRVGQACVRGDAGRLLIELPPAQCVQQVASKDDALSAPTGKVVADQVLGTRIHCLSNLQ